MTDERSVSTPLPPPPVRPAKVTGAKPVASGLVGLSLLLSAGALGAAGFLWWQNDQFVVAQGTREAEVQERLFHLTRQLDDAREGLSKQEQAQATLQSRVDDLESQRDLLQQKVDLVDQRIIKVMKGTARVDWMLAEVVHLVMVAERRLSHLGDVRGALALLESAEKVVGAMEEPLARALRQALVDDLQRLRSAQEQVIDTEGLLLRINSAKKLVVALQPPRPSFRSEPVVLDEASPEARDGISLFWYKVKTFVGSLVHFQKNKEPLMSVAVDPQARFYLQQSILLLLDQAQLAVLRGEPTTYALALRETTERIQRYLRVDTQEGEQLMLALDTLAQQPVEQQVPAINESLLALDAFRMAWEKGRAAREAAAERLLEHAADTDQSGTGTDGQRAEGRLP